MSEPCRAIRGADEQFTCASHGGTFMYGRWHECSMHPSPFAQATAAATEALRRQVQQLAAEVKRFEGWHLNGFSEQGWEAIGPAPGNARLTIVGPTPHGLVERIRQALNPQNAPTQGVLL